MYGDSGGPAFVQDDSGALLIAGLTNFLIMFRSHSYSSWRDQRFGTFGEGCGGLIVPPFASWIDSIVGAGGVPSNAVYTMDESDVSSAMIQNLRETDYDIYEAGERGPRRR